MPLPPLYRRSWVSLVSALVGALTLMLVEPAAALADTGTPPADQTPVVTVTGSEVTVSWELPEYADEQAPTTVRLVSSRLDVLTGVIEPGEAHTTYTFPHVPDGSWATHIYFGNPDVSLPAAHFTVQAVPPPGPPVVTVVGAEVTVSGDMISGAGRLTIIAITLTSTRGSVIRGGTQPNAQGYSHTFSNVPDGEWTAQVEVHNPSYYPPSVAFTVQTVVPPDVVVVGSDVTVSWDMPANEGRESTAVVIITGFGGSSLSAMVRSGPGRVSHTFVGVPIGEGTVIVRFLDRPRDLPRVSFTVEASRPATPSPPNSHVDGNSVVVSWAAPTDGGSPITGYLIELSGGQAPLVREVSADSFSVSFDALAPGTYTATVAAVNAVGSSATSAASEPVTVAFPDSNEPPDDDAPGGEEPGGEEPGGEDPGEHNPGDQTPDDEKPQDEQPGDEQTPGDEIPSDENSEPSSAAPDSESSDDHHGGVRVPDSATPGSRIAVAVGAQRAGTQVQVWFHSAPVLLGTVTVDEQGNTAVTIPSDATLGDHRVVVRALDGSLIGWDTIRISAPSQREVGSDSLAASGVEEITLQLSSIALFLLAAGGLALTGLRLREKAKAAS